MRPAASTPARIHERRPEPATFWVRYRPEPWPAADRRWIDLARGRFGRAAPGVAAIEPPSLPAAALDDTWYLPPVCPEAAPSRDRWATALVASGAPVVVQLLAGEPWRCEGAALVVDLTEALLARRLDELPSPPPGAWGTWPLIGGVTDGEETVEAGCRRLAALGFSGVHGVVVDLAPEERRGLVEELGEGAFHRLFHGERPSERAFCRRAAAAGLETLPLRPLPASGGRLVRNREIAGRLLLLGDLWLRLGRPAREAHDLFRAARWIDGCPHDVAALGREGNLAVVPQLGTGDRMLIVELVEEGRLAALDEAMAAYLGGRELPGP